MPTIHSQPTPSAFQSGPEATIAPLLTPGLSLSPASEPFPAKLVERVRSGQFVEMRDLLTDNIALLQQLEVFRGQCPLQTLPGALKPRLRDVVSLPSWMYCFLAYVAIRSRDPATRDMLAYARLLIREAQRHGGSGGWTMIGYSGNRLRSTAPCDGIRCTRTFKQQPWWVVLLGQESFAPSAESQTMGQSSVP